MAAGAAAPGPILRRGPSAAGWAFKEIERPIRNYPGERTTAGMAGPVLIQDSRAQATGERRR
jgi:hypothetical protein